MSAGFYVTITGLPESFYTNQFRVDLSDGWTVEQFRVEVCLEVGCDGCSHELQKGGVALTTTDAMDEATGSGDTIALVEV
jgi:hypothetical protein